MKTFAEIFAKFNPLEKSSSIDYNNISDTVDSILSMGEESERTRIYNAVQQLDVDSFDDIVYKEDVLSIIKGENKWAK